MSSMKSLNMLILAGLAGFTATSAMAQEPAPAATPAPATAANDAEIGKFASALLAVSEIQKDTALSDADKQKAMAAKVQASGLEAARFNELATKLQSGDAEFQKQVQVELAKLQTPPAG